MTISESVRIIQSLQRDQAVERRETEPDLALLDLLAEEEGLALSELAQQLESATGYGWEIA